MRRAFRSLVLGLAWASIWPGYLVLVAQAARLGPWPRNLGILASTILHALALGLFVPGVLAWMTRRDGWTERFLGIPAAVGRQFCRAGRFLSVAAVICLVPAYLLSYGEIAPDGRPITAPVFCRFFILAFEMVVWACLLSLLRRGSALMNWCDIQPCSPAVAEIDGGKDQVSGNAISSSVPWAETAVSESPSWIAWLSRRRRFVAWMLLGITAAIVVLDVRGYRFTSRRLAAGGSESLAVLLICWALNRSANRLITQHARRWVRQDSSGHVRSPPRWPCAVRLGTAARKRPAGLRTGTALGMIPARPKTWRRGSGNWSHTRLPWSPFWPLRGSGNLTWR